MRRPRPARTSGSSAEVEASGSSSDEVVVGTGPATDLAGYVFSTLPLPVLARMTRPAAVLADIEWRPPGFGFAPWCWCTPSIGRPLDRHSTRTTCPARDADHPDLRAGQLPRQRGRPARPHRFVRRDPVREDRTSLVTRRRARRCRGRGAARTGCRPATGVHVESGSATCIRCTSSATRTACAAWTTGPGCSPGHDVRPAGLFVHDNTHHALAMAYDAVDALGTTAVRP